MSLHGPFRRVVTAHAPDDMDGTHVILHDGEIPLKPALEGRAAFTPIFAAEGLPVVSHHHITADDVAATHALAPGVVTPNGHNGAVTDVAPGFRIEMHRTNSVDYNIFTKGSAFLITPSPEGEKRTLCKVGDVVVQRGTIHAWEAGPEGARWVSVIVAALPVEVGGRPLDEVDFK